MLSTVRKVEPVLALFTPDQPSRRLSEITEALDMPKSSVHSLVSTLVEAGLLNVDEHRTYRLSWSLLLLDDRMRTSLDLERVARPAMHALSDEVRETVFLAELDYRQVRYLERVESALPHPTVRLAGVQPGARLPLHSTSMGKALLHDRDEDQIRWLLGQTELRRMTSRTLTDVDDIVDAILAVRRDGVAYDINEMTADVCCISAPIWDRYESVVAAISMSVPAYRFAVARPRLLQPLLRAATEITEAIGGRPRAGYDVQSAAALPAI